MTDENFDFLETDIDDEEIASFNKRFCVDQRASEVIASLRRRGMDDREIVVAFRLIARVPKEWELEKEPDGKAAKRRAALADKLKKLASEVENDPDLSGLCFGINTISYGTPKDDRKDLTSLADCIREGVRELDPDLPPAIKVSITTPDKPRDGNERTIALKKFAIEHIFGLINKPEKRAPNKETATLTSILLGEDISANDVTQARKAERRKYFRDR